MIEKNDLEKIKKNLPKTGYVEAINQVLETNGQKQYASSYVRNVLNGRKRNDQIILAAIKVAEETKILLQKIEKM